MKSLALPALTPSRLDFDAPGLHASNRGSAINHGLPLGVILPSELLILLLFCAGTEMVLTEKCERGVVGAEIPTTDVF